jgi:hypothetical protein
VPRPPQLSTEILNTFVTVIDCGGDASAAANMLDINQPSMSKRLAFLQHPGKILKNPWLVKKGKNWGLTEEGNKKILSVRELLNKYENILQDSATKEDSKSEVFAIGSEHLNIIKNKIYHNSKFYVCDDYDRIDLLSNGSVDVILTAFTKEEAFSVFQKEFNCKILMSGHLAQTKPNSLDIAVPKYGFVREKAKDFIDLKNIKIEFSSFSDLMAMDPEINALVPNWYKDSYCLEPKIEFNVYAMYRKADSDKIGIEEIVRNLSMV